MPRILSCAGWPAVLMALVFIPPVLSARAQSDSPDTVKVAEPNATQEKPLPFHLLSILAQAEDATDFAMAGDWSRIQSDAHTIENTWKTYQKQLTKEGKSPGIPDAVLADYLRQLNDAAIHKDATLAQQAASNVSASVSNLLDSFHPQVPVDVQRLAILEKQIAVDGSAGNFRGADRSLSKAKMIWNRLKGPVQDRQGHELALKYETNLTAQEISISVNDATATREEAGKGQQIVQNMANLYGRQ